MAFIITDSCMVRPIEPTFTGRLPLSLLDQTDIISHVPLILFYKHPQTCLSPDSSISNTLKNSLSKVLVPFYPLAGRLQGVGNGHLELDCNGKGVSFIEAETEFTLADLGDFTPTPQHNFLVPTVDSSLPIHEQPVLLVQLTSFRCGGFSITVNTSHAVVDGLSAGYFLHVWSRLTRGEPLHTVPFHDRKLIRAAGPLIAMAPTSISGFLEYSNLPLLLGKNDNSEERKGETKMAILKLTRSQVEMLKKMADESWDKPNGRSYTRFEALTAHVWRSTCKARGHKYEQPTSLAIPVDIRSRMQPPLPRQYFGNAILISSVTSFSGEVATKPLGYAASRVRIACEKITDGYARSAINFLTNQEDLTKFQVNRVQGNEGGIFGGNPNMFVTSWLTLDLNGFDFGWGKEVFVGRGYSDDEDGESYIIPSAEGDGSVRFTVCLQVAHMDAFKKHFYEDIKCSSRLQSTLSNVASS